jgi:putative FmdB family regulatory protein
MPIYEYRCEQGHTFEVIQRISDDPVATCQTCEAPVERVYHPVAVHFKGSGFYNTDYGTRKRQRENSESESSDKKGSSEKKADSGKSDSAKSEGGSKSESGSKAEGGSKQTESKAAA